MNFNPIHFNKNIIFVKDLYDAQGLPITKNKLEAIVECPIMFATYHALWRSVPNDCINKIKNVTKDYNMKIPLKHKQKRYWPYKNDWA